MTIQPSSSARASEKTDALPRPSLVAKLLDEGRFLRQWAGSPLTIGAICPSGPDLAARMASFIDLAIDGPVVELGPGTGVVTQAILERGIAPERLTSIEYCQNFAALLGDRFPEIDIVRGDAYDLETLLGNTEQRAPLAAIVSSLPLFTSTPEKRLSLILDGLDRLAPGAPFIQFSYALVPPVRAQPDRFTFTKTGWIVRNMPPARVWVYRKA